MDGYDNEWVLDDDLFWLDQEDEDDDDVYPL